MRVFIAGPLLNAKALDLDFYRELARACREAGLEPFLPHLQIDQEANRDLIFRNDVEALKACGLLIAEVSTPSHGVGGEVMLAYLEQIPVICLAQDGAKVSVMVLGNPMVRQVIRYKNVDDCSRELTASLQSFRPL